MEIAFQILFVLILVLLNGYFVASEFALVGVRKTRIDELVKKGNKSAKLVQNALTDLDSVISATQLGITIASIALGWVGEPAIAKLIEPIFQFLPVQLAIISAHTLSVILAFTVITFLHIILGELTPKSIALQRAEATSLIIILPLLIFTRIFKPIIWILNSAGGLVLKLFGISAPAGHQLVHSEEEIKILLSQSVESGAIEKEEAEMVYKVFQLGDIPIRQIMVPRLEIIAIETKDSLNKILKKIKQNSHSRFPIYKDSIDKIIGFVHIKDIYRQALDTKNKTSFLLRNKNKSISPKLFREIISLPETKRADDALIDMRKKRVHMAVVNDEYGGTAGIVTMEDIIESLVGEIHDEFEKPMEIISRQADGSYLIDGLLSVERLQDRFNLPLKGQGYTSVGGLVFGLLGREPKKGDAVQIGKIRLIVERVQGRRVKQIRLEKIKLA